MSRFRITVEWPGGGVSCTRAFASVLDAFRWACGRYQHRAPSIRIAQIPETATP